MLAVSVAELIPFPGQIDLLQHCLVVQGQEFDDVVARARADGFEVDEEEEEMEEDEDQE